jgi:hypothetical protein
MSTPRTPSDQEPAPLSDLQRLQELSERLSTRQDPTFRSFADELAESTYMGLFLGVQDVAKTIRPDPDEH